MNAQTKLVYPIQEAFVQLGVSHSRGYELIKDGRLKTFLNGRRRLVTHKELEACIEVMQRAPAAPKKQKQQEAA